MPRRIGGQNFEGQFFIITVPNGWVPGDPLPVPSPEDRWFDRVEDFKAALDCPWVRRPLRHLRWTSPDAGRAASRPARAPAPAGRRT